jgi:hypothetical protein
MWSAHRLARHRACMSRVRLLNRVCMCAAHDSSFRSSKLSKSPTLWSPPNDGGIAGLCQTLTRTSTYSSRQWMSWPTLSAPRRATFKRRLAGSPLSMGESVDTSDHSTVRMPHVLCARARTHTHVRTRHAACALNHTHPCSIRHSSAPSSSSRTHPCSIRHTSGPSSSSVVFWPHAPIV